MIKKKNFYSEKQIIDKILKPKFKIHVYTTLIKFGELCFQRQKIYN